MFYLIFKILRWIGQSSLKNKNKKIKETKRRKKRKKISLISHSQRVWVKLLCMNVANTKVSEFDKKKKLDNFNRPITVFMLQKGLCTCICIGIHVCCDTLSRKLCEGEQWTFIECFLTTKKRHPVLRTRPFCLYRKSAMTTRIITF